MEEWKTIDGHSNYRVSTFGRVQKMRIERFLTGFIRKTGNNTYRFVGLDHKAQPQIHRLVATAFIPNPNNLPFVDHVDGDGLNNNVTNLRWCTRQQNNQNKRYTSGSASGFKGVRKNNKRWQARLMLDYKEIHIGTYDTREEAARAYDAKATELFGEFARLNFPVTTV